MNNIRKLRLQKKLTQIELAQLCNTTQGTISSYENGRYEPDLQTLKRMADIFGVSIDDITDYTPGETQTPTGVEVDRELWELREHVRRDPDRNYLFSLAKGADIEDVRQAIAIIDALKKTRRD